MLIRIARVATGRAARNIASSQTTESAILLTQIELHDKLRRSEESEVDPIRCVTTGMVQPGRNVL